MGCELSHWLCMHQSTVLLVPSFNCSLVLLKCSQKVPQRKRLRAMALRSLEKVTSCFTLLKFLACLVRPHFGSFKCSSLASQSRLQLHKTSHLPVCAKQHHTAK